MKQRLTQLLEKFKKDILARFPKQIVSLTLFGSQARGDAKKDSDVDILVVTRSSDWHLGDQIGEIAYNLLLETGVYISTKVMSRERYDYLREIQAPFINNVSKDGIPL